MLKAIERLLATARAEIGYLEKATNAQLDSKTGNAGYNNWTKYARDLDQLGVYNFPKNGYAWCDMFADWCFVKTFGVELAWKMTGQAMKGSGAGCTCSADYYRAIGRFFVSDPQPGDQIFFKDTDGGMGHTGLVERVANGYVYTIEGNTSSAAGVVANGGSVNAKSYPINYAKIGGYGRPRWELVPDADDDQDNHEQEDGEVNLETFKKLWHEMRKELQDNDAADYSKEAREWAVQQGIVKGGSAAEFNGMWEDVLTREQMVTLLFRFAKLMGIA